VPPLGCWWVGGATRLDTVPEGPPTCGVEGEPPGGEVGRGISPGEVTEVDHCPQRPGVDPSRLRQAKGAAGGGEVYTEVLLACWGCVASPGRGAGAYPALVTTRRLSCLLEAETEHARKRQVNAPRSVDQRRPGSRPRVGNGPPRSSFGRY